MYTNSLWLYVLTLLHCGYVYKLIVATYTLAYTTSQLVRPFTSTYVKICQFFFIIQAHVQVLLHQISAISCDMIEHFHKLSANITPFYFKSSFQFHR